MAVNKQGKTTGMARATVASKGKAGGTASTTRKAAASSNAASKKKY